MDEPHERAVYVVPSYGAPQDTSWYHFLHGNVPGHQIDFIYRAEVPQGPLTRQHFSHLARLMKYIEPPSHQGFAFAVGNLSRDDTQYEPGHGGVALIFGMRIHGATDHAGRQDPPFAHAVAAIDRALDASTLLESALSFHRHVLGAAQSAEWYRAYVRAAQEDPGSVGGVLEDYVDRFADLPQPGESAMAIAWVTGGAAQPRRIVVCHDDDVSFGEVASAAARIAAVLYRSDIRWTIISNGREDDVPGGVTVRLLSRSQIGSADGTVPVHDLAALPEDEADLASLLFGARPVTTEVQKPRGWRERYSGAGAPPPPARPRRGEGEDEISHDEPFTIGGDPPQASGPLRRSGPGAAPLPRASPPVAAPPPAPAIEPAPLRRVPMSEPPAGDRAASFELAIPPAPREVEVKQHAPPPPPVAEAPPPPSPPAAPPVAKAAPKPTSVPPPIDPARAAVSREPASPRRTAWIVVGGLALVAVVVVAVLTSKGSTPAEAGGSTSTAPALQPSSTATTLLAEPPPPARPPEPPPPTTAQQPSHAPSDVPTASAAPAVKRPPRRPQKPSPSILGGDYVP